MDIAVAVKRVKRGESRGLTFVVGEGKRRQRHVLSLFHFVILLFSNYLLVTTRERGVWGHTARAKAMANV